VQCCIQEATLGVIVGLVSGETLRRLFCVALDNLTPPHQPQRTISKSSMPPTTPPTPRHSTAPHDRSRALLPAVRSSICRGASVQGCAEQMFGQASEASSPESTVHKAVGQLASSPPHFLHNSSTPPPQQPVGRRCKREVASDTPGASRSEGFRLACGSSRLC
jgi:hypothetical protein